MKCHIPKFNLKFSLIATIASVVALFLMGNKFEETDIPIENVKWIIADEIEVSKDFQQIYEMIGNVKCYCQEGNLKYTIICKRLILVFKKERGKLILDKIKVIGDFQKELNADNLQLTDSEGNGIRFIIHNKKADNNGEGVPSPPSQPPQLDEDKAPQVK
jgi:hypothetical protein